MITIVMAVPYPEMEELAYETFDEHMEYSRKVEKEEEYELKVICGATTDEILSYEIDGDVLIARGATVYDLKKNRFHMPVVEIMVMGNDLITALYECNRRYPDETVGVIGSLNMVFGIENIARMMDIRAKVYNLNLNSMVEIRRNIDKAKDDGLNVIIGGKRGMEYARSIGIDGVAIVSGKETIWRAITEAKQIAQVSREERARTLTYKTILDYAYEGVIAIDKDNGITAFNSSAQKILGQIGSEKYIGRDIRDVVRANNLLKLIQDHDEYIDEIVNFKNTHLAINKVPIMLGSENIGKVMTFQNDTKIQEIEGKLRGKIYTKGHLAKYVFSDIVGKSDEIQEAISAAKTFAALDSNIMLIGETGTGKELFAQSIHNASMRRKGPFVAVNCAAIPESLLESELFGYVEGAFTGASKGGKPGLFELAHNGTIFLDEISELPIKLQGRLLRVIQEREIMRLGHDKVIPVNVRIISATNKNLKKMIEDGIFREDLYYRIYVLKINIPPLRKRGDDIILLCNDFISDFCNMFGKKDMTITKEAMEVLKAYSWNGNIRELKNICERVVALNTNNIINNYIIQKVISYDESFLVKESVKGDLKHSETEIETDVNGNMSIEEMKEKEEIKRVLKKYRNNKTRAAKELGISRVTLWRRIEKFKIE